MLPLDPVEDSPDGLPSPLSRLLDTIAASGLQGHALLHAVVDEINAEILVFAAEATATGTAGESVAHDQRHPDPHSVIDSIAGLSRTLLDVLPGFADLRANPRERESLCQTAELFIAAGSAWTTRWIATLRGTGRAISGNTVVHSWLTVRRELMIGIDRCRMDNLDVPRSP
ncbi:hypothetical protein [Amycolatopsis sp. cmx-4-61]|uniref:hypothetical protein n=1 Tax=Amycolatopsis sp. cmx-4-61 TaxID=2790937 RepID=UPI003978729F